MLSKIAHYTKVSRNSSAATVGTWALSSVTSVSSLACPLPIIGVAHLHHHYTTINPRPPLIVTIPSLPTPATAPHPCLSLPLFGTALMDQRVNEGEIFTETESACASLPLPRITVASPLQGTQTTIPTFIFPLRIIMIALLPVVAIEMTHGFILQTDVGESICRLILHPVTATTAAALHLLVIPLP